MTWKIAKRSHSQRTTVHLIGRMKAQHLQDLQTLIDESGPTIALDSRDLEELTLVDLDAVRFLGRCQNAVVSLLHCSQYIRDWIEKERNSAGQT
jgi:hypothetical protein